MTSVSKIDDESEDLFTDEYEHRHKITEKNNGRRKGHEYVEQGLTTSVVDDVSSKDYDGYSAVCNDSNGVLADDSDDGFVIPQRFAKNRRRNLDTPFPLKLMKVLSMKKFHGIIRWMPSGKSFIILNAEAFVSSILTTRFKSTQFESFLRKLRRWGFVKHFDYRFSQDLVYCHKEFQKGRLDLVEKMKIRKAGSPDGSLVSHELNTETTSGAPCPPYTQISKVTQKSPKANEMKRNEYISIPDVPAAMPLKSGKNAGSPVNELDFAGLDEYIEMEVSRRLNAQIHDAPIQDEAPTIVQQHHLPQTLQVQQGQNEQIQQQQRGMFFVDGHSPPFPNFGILPIFPMVPFMGQPVLVHDPRMTLTANPSIGGPLFPTFDANMPIYNQFPSDPEEGDWSAIQQPPIHFDDDDDEC